jgi:hypothetical protein
MGILIPIIQTELSQDNFGMVRMVLHRDKKNNDFSHGRADVATFGRRWGVL